MDQPPVQTTAYRIPAKLTGVFVILALVFAAIGAMLFIGLRDAVRADVQRNIVAVGVLKNDQIADWLDDRYSDARTLSDRSFFSREATLWMRDGARDDSRRSHIKERLESFISGHHFRTIVLYDLHGRVRLRAGQAIEDSAQMSAAALRVIASGRTELVDLHAHRDPQFPLGMGIISPLHEGNSYSGAIYLVEDPERYLFPLIEHWPSASTSAEIQLVRVEGDQVRFLNHLRHRPEAGFDLRMPLADVELAAAAAGRGQRGLFEHAHDYQGNVVLAYAAAVPGTPWLLISKIDEAEAYRLLDRIYLLAMALAIVVFGLGAAWLWQWWRREQAAHGASLLQDKLRAEERLLESEARFRTIFERAALGVGRLTPEGRFIDINDTWCRMLGYRKQEILGGEITSQRISHPDDLATNLEHGRRLLAGEIPDYDLEMRYLRKDGSVLWVHLSVGLVRKINDDPDYLISAVQDISRYKLAETKLADSNALLAMALNAAQEAVWEWDLVSGEARFSPEYYTMLGYAPDEFPASQREWVQHIHPEDRDAVLGKIKADLQQRQGLHLAEYRMRTKDGSYLWLLGRGKCVAFDADGRPTRMVGINLDITERKKAELQTSFMAYHDRLTGLPNRTLFFDRLSQAISLAKRNSQHAALLFIDLDGFKPINDEYGHEAGDAVLKMVAQRLLACVRAVDTVARMGGDEFAVVLGDLVSPSEVERVAEKILQAFAQPMQLPDGESCAVGVSIGISSYPDNGNEMDKLLGSADGAMYESKRRGKNCFTFCNSPHVGDVQSWVPFDDTHHVGIGVIDEQHRELVRRVNLLNDALRKNLPESGVEQQFAELLDFTALHFATEHRLMEESNYPEMATHDVEHTRLVDEALHFKGRLQQGGDLFALQTIKDWLLNHIRYSDKAMANYLISRGFH